MKKGTLKIFLCGYCGNRVQELKLVKISTKKYSTKHFY